MTDSHAVIRYSEEGGYHSGVSEACACFTVSRFSINGRIYVRETLYIER